jgi:NTP pyrophosphatase (non-canonical NTP hydrolase)
MAASGDFSIGGEVWPGLSKLIEECGEVQQVAGKLIGARGATDHWDGSDLRERLTSELGDLSAAIRLVIALNGIDDRLVHARQIEKTSLFLQWHREQTAPLSLQSTTLERA